MQACWPITAISGVGGASERRQQPPID